MYKFEGQLTLLSTQVWGCGIFIPIEISTSLIEQGHKRVVCTLNNVSTYQCALMPRGDHEYFINVNKELQRKLKINPGDTLSIDLKPDTSEYGLPMPEELGELLKQDADGDSVFHGLTLGKQRTLLHLIGKPKSSEIRLRKAITIIEYLKEVNGKLNFKDLNEAIKNGNRYQ
jgi:Domain of unknown function (DUF1905)/Bacteriocin-protection, YdeI or OmpD-Associated